MSETIRDLLELAKGERSFRTYADDCGINSSVMTKIMKGTYIPGPKMIETLTSEQAAPRNGVTKEAMLKAISNSEEFRRGLKAGNALLEGGLILSVATVSALGMNPLILPFTSALMSTKAVNSKSKKDNKDNEDSVERFEKEKLTLEKEQKQFIAISKGIIYGKLVEKDISFKQDQCDSNAYLNSVTDVRLLTTQSSYDEFILRFMYISESADDSLIEAISKNCLGELVFIPNTESVKKKISLVINNRKAFEYLKSFTDTLSFKGNLSIIKIDIENSRWEAERILATYDVEKDELQI